MGIQTSRQKGEVTCHHKSETIALRLQLHVVASIIPIINLNFTHSLCGTQCSSKTGVINAWQQLQVNLVLGKIHIVHLGYIIPVQSPFETNPLLHFQTSLFFHHSEDICHLFDRHHLQQ